MARSYPILSITPASPGSPAKITIAGNHVPSFQGKFYRQTVSPFAVQQFYTDPLVTPAGYSLIKATTFEIIENTTYAGKYTVYTQVSAIDPTWPAWFAGVNTEIAVNEIISAPLPANASDVLNTGKIVNISTYSIQIRTASTPTSLYIPPTVLDESTSLALTGRDSTPWGESIAQNFVDLTQNFSSSAAPADALLGQLWYNSALNEVNLLTTTGWTVIASGIAGSNTVYRFTQASAATTWSVPHNLNLVFPYVAMIQVFVDRGPAGYKMLMTDITFTDANNISVQFSNPEVGIVLIKK